MNPDIKIRRVFTPNPSFRSAEKRKPKINFHYKKNSLNKILKNINIIKRELFDNKSNNIFNYNFNKYIHKSRTNNKRYNNNIAYDFFERETFSQREDKNDTNSQIKSLKWNYSYNHKNNNDVIKRTLSSKKYRILNIMNKKEPDIVYNWQKPRMIKILEKNAFIEEEIKSKPWRFFYNYENEKY